MSSDLLHLAPIKSSPIAPQPFVPSVEVAEPNTSMPKSRAVAVRPVRLSRRYEQPMNQHTDWAKRYYSDQLLRPNVPVSPQPNSEDIARRLQTSGIRTIRLDTLVQEAPERQQAEIANMQDITPSLEPTLSSRSNEGSECPEANADNGVQNLDESYEMVGYHIDLTEVFEQVDRDIPPDFNGKISH